MNIFSFPKKTGYQRIEGRLKKNAPKILIGLAVFTLFFVLGMSISNKLNNNYTKSLQIAFLTKPSPAAAATQDPPFSTTFNCTVGNITNGWSCGDGVTKYWGSGECYGTCNYSQTHTPSITNAANNPLGSGNGFREWIYGDVNQAGYDINVIPYSYPTFTTPQKELWIRWYMRFQSGINFANGYYMKTMYIRTNDSADSNSCVGDFSSADGYILGAQGGGGSSSAGQDDASCSGCGLQTMSNGATVTDGTWHSLELHIKMDTNGGSGRYANGVAQFWLDGVLKINNTTMNWSNGNATAQQGWTWFDFPNNFSHGAGLYYDTGGQEVYVDWDDVSVANTAPAARDASSNPMIGPIGWGATDTTPSTISGGSPSGTLAAGTTQTTLVVTTNENATCKYSTTAGTAYATMANTFSTTGGTSHSKTITGLTNSSSYTYYVRCQDTAGNPNTSDYAVSFSVSSPTDTTPPTISAGSPTGALAAGTTQTTLSVTTNENATCKYSATANTSYASMVNTFSTTGNTSHSKSITGLTNGSSYTYYVRCQDTAGNPDTSDYTVSFSVSSPSGKNIYVSTTGSDSVTYANNDINHPWATWAHALLTAQAGDTVYFRAGTYTISSELNMYSGHNGTLTSPITYSNYPGEKVVVNVNAQIDWDVQYNWLIADAPGNIELDGGSQDFIIVNGNNGDGSHFKLINCKLKVTSTDTQNNASGIDLQANRSNYALIQNNEFIGPGGGKANGVIILGGANCPPSGSNQGSAIKNNNIHEFGNAIYIKHANSDTSLGAAEIAYNYLYNSSNGIYGNPWYENIHDNVIVGCGIVLGDNGGGSQGAYNLINHNTIVGSISFINQGPSCGSERNITHCTITNNIASNYSGTGSNNSYDYNIYRSGIAIGTHDFGNTSPTYAGGSSPSTITGYTLTSGSVGHAAGSDSKDLGADVSLVGIQGGGSSDTNPPTISGGSPTGVLAVGTTQSTLAVTTNENATCKYSTTANTSYASMASTFSTTGGTSHSKTIIGLTNGSSYTYYVRCQDSAGNPNTSDYTISFSVSNPSDTTPPVISGGSPTGTLAANTTQTTLAVTSNENATCKYSTTASTAYASMTNTFSTTGGTSHSKTITSLTNGTSYTYYVRCQDTAGNPDVSDYTISFNVSNPADTTPPVISGGSPSGTLAANTTQATLQVTTDENATCRYSNTPNVGYLQMTNFTTTGATTHTKTITGLTNGSSYTYYVRCQDSGGYTNVSDYTIQFSVAQTGTVTCTSFTYSDWGTCQSDNTQTRTVLTSSPLGCAGGSPTLTQSCTYVPTCTSFSYSDWSACQPNSTQSRTVLTSSPANCSGGNPTLSQSCTYSSGSGGGGGGGGGSSSLTCTSFTFSSWSACQPNSTQSRTVTTSIPSGCTGGNPQLAQYCTYSATSSSSNQIVATSSCTSFTYTGWSACQSNNTQERTVASTKPAICAGGNPILTQSCNYNSSQPAVYSSSTPNTTSITDLNNQPSTVVNNVTEAEATVVNNYNLRVKLNTVDTKLYTTTVKQSPVTLSDQNKYSVAYFIHFGTPSTQKLGMGERTGVINSYQAALNKLPRSITEWQDVIKIANGRWPTDRSTTAETKAKATFQTVYLRAPNSSNAYDNTAVMIMAYGLRPLSRNVASEKTAIKTFKSIFGTNPATTKNWDVVRAIAYSGASR